MRHYLRSGVALMGMAFVVLGSAGCATSSYSSTRTYEYTDEPQAARVVGQESQSPMVSPGQMASPGKMVSPGEMVSPGSTDDE